MADKTLLHTAAQVDAAVDHSQGAHAPANAQKNSDIIQSEIEAKLVGTVTTHNHKGAGDAYPTVANFAALPAASEHGTEIYVVLASTGVWLIARKTAGLYYSNGTTWTRLGNLPEWYSDNNFEIYNAADESKAVKFLTSGITTATTRTLTVPDADGTIALTSDLTVKQKVITTSTSAPVGTDGTDGDIWFQYAI